MSHSKKKKIFNGDIEWTADMWFAEFFNRCKLPKEAAQTYSVSFANNGMTWDMLPILNADHLKEMKITKVGHSITIIKHAAEVFEQVERKEALEQSNSPKKLSSVCQPVNKTVEGPRMINLKGNCNKRPRELLHVVPPEDSSEMKKPRALPPNEEPTLTVKLPVKNSPQPSSQMSNRLSPLTHHHHQETRQSVKERLSNPQSLEVSSSTEKDQQLSKINYPAGVTKRSVFDRLGNTVASPAVSPPKSGVPLKKAVGQCDQPSPLKNPPTMANRGQQPVISRVLFHSPHDPHKVPSRKLLKSDQPSVVKDTRYGSMAADLETADEQNGRNAIHTRLGNRFSKEGPNRKKRVSFGGVVEQEIPAIPGTVPVTKPFSAFSYQGSIALGTYRDDQ